MRLKFGTMSTLFRERLGTAAHMDYVTALARAAACGFTAVDLNLCQICAHKTTLHTDEWRREADEVLDAARRHNITLHQCHLPFKSKKVKWRTPEDLAYYDEMFLRAVDAAAHMGIPWAVVHPERCPEHPEYDGEMCYQANRNHWLPLVEYALGRGLSLAFENMQAKPQAPGNRYCADVGELLALVDSFADERVGVCWDTGHANLYYPEGQGAALRRVGKRLRCTHIHDNRRDSDLHLLPWQGLADWPDIMDALRDIGFDGYLTLETSANYYTPDDLKDEVGRHAHAVMRRLAAL